MTRFACFSLISMTAEDARTEYLASLQNRTHVDPHSYLCRLSLAVRVESVVTVHTKR